jgi:hypothetical protein
MSIHALAQYPMYFILRCVAQHVDHNSSKCTQVVHLKAKADWLNQCVLYPQLCRALLWLWVRSHLFQQTRRTQHARSEPSCLHRRVLVCYPVVFSAQPAALPPWVGSRLASHHGQYDIYLNKPAASKQCTTRQCTILMARCQGGPLQLCVGCAAACPPVYPVAGP